MSLSNLTSPGWVVLAPKGDEWRCATPAPEVTP